MDYKTEVESDVLKLLDKYDAEALIFLFHFRGKRSHLKFVFPDDSKETWLSIFSVLAKLSHDANVPALFLIPSNSKMVCGVWYADQLLLIMNPNVEGVVMHAYKGVIKELFSGSVGRPLKNLFICCTPPLRDSSKEWSGALCIEIIEKFEEMYLQIPDKFQQWYELVKEYPKTDYSDFSYYTLTMAVVFENETAQYISQPGMVFNYKAIRVLFENQKHSVLNLLRQPGLPAMKVDDAYGLKRAVSAAPETNYVNFLKDYYYRAFWQIVVHRLLVDQVHLEARNQKSAERLSLPSKYNLLPMSEIAYSQLLKLMREMSKIGSAEVDRLYTEVLQAQIEDRSSYDSGGSVRHRESHSNEVGSDSLPKKLSAELAISYVFVGQKNWPVIKERKGKPTFLAGLEGARSEQDIKIDRYFKSISIKPPASGQSKLFFLSDEEAHEVARLGGKLLIKQRPECSECVQLYSDRLMLLNENYKPYDIEIISLFLNNRGNQKQLKMLICSDVEDEIAYELQSLNQDSLSTQQPALFLIGYKGSFTCGALSDNKILWISPYGERDIEGKDALLKRLMSASASNARSLFVVSQRILHDPGQNGYQADGSGLICLELLALLSHDMVNIPQRMSSWEKHSKIAIRSIMGLSYNLVEISDVFIPHPLSERICQGVLEWAELCEIRGAQLSWLPVLLYLHSREDAFLNQNRANGSSDSIDPNNSEKSSSSPKSDRISSPTQFFVQQSTRLEGELVDLAVLEVKLKALLGEWASIVSNILSAARTLEEIDGVAYSKHRCGKYLNKYQCFFRLAQNSDCINDIFSYSMIRLDKHLACCQLARHESITLIDENRVICERLTRQKLLLESRDKITHASLKSAFPNHDVNTLRMVLRDRELCANFSTGVMELLVNHINIERAYQATIQFFSELQKIIALVEVVQLVFKLKFINNSSSADLIKRELQDQIRASVRPAPGDDASKSSSQTTENFSRW